MIPAVDAPPPSAISTERVEQDRLRYLARRGGDAAETLARLDTYWTRGIAVGYLELLDEVASDDPPKAAAMAEAAPQLVERAAMGRGDARWRTPAELASYRALSWAFLSSCRRQAGDVDGAQAAMERATELAERQGVAEWARAEVARRRSILIAFVDGPEAALPWTTRVVELFRASGYEPGLAEALTFQGTILYYLRRFDEAVEAYCAALHHASSDTLRGRRTQTTASWQLAAAADKASSSGRLLRQSTTTVRALLKRTRSRQLRGRMVWTLGLLELRVGAHRSASRQLRRAAELLTSRADGATLTLLALDVARLAYQAGPDPTRNGVDAQVAQALGRIARALDGQTVETRLREVIEAWAEGVAINETDLGTLAAAVQEVRSGSPGVRRSA